MINYPIAVLTRTPGKNQTDGILSFSNGDINTIERPERDANGNLNTPMVTCVLPDDYLCTWEEMHDHPGHFHYRLEDKHGRSGCFIHYIDMTIPDPASQLEGCVGGRKPDVEKLENWLSDHAPFILRVRG